MLRIILNLPATAWLSLLLLTFSCTPGETEPGLADCKSLSRDNADDCIRINQIQMLGTHNSYKLRPAGELVQRLNAGRPGWADNINYEHRPLTEQLEELGIRQFELDIFADTRGGLYSEPAGAVMIGEEAFIRPGEMMEPGFKVIHVQDIDYRSTCLTFVSCMREIRDWSLMNPNHLPILILVEVKEGARTDEGSVSYTVPIPFDEPLMDEIDREIWSVFAKDHVITPDEVRGDFATLEEAVLSQGWPTLARGRGRVYFGLDNTNHIKDLYLSRSPVLEERALFASAGPGEPAGAFIKMNDALNTGARIRERVEAGFIIRTRSDIPGQEGVTGDVTRREAALGSGAQYISTDYPEVSPFGSGYIVRLPGAAGPGRCNPVSAPADCRNEYITE
ncbi:MAG: phosphatidylinositol-specific phospholipase C1-like protein [Balneolales bacterium]